MADNFSNETQALFTLAADISAQIKHHYIGAEHIFLACAKLDRPTMTNALQAGDIVLNKIIDKLLDIMSDAPTLPASSEMLITPRLSQLLDAAQSDDGSITLEVVIPLLFREGGSLPCYLIRQMEGNLEAIAIFLDANHLATSADAQKHLAKVRNPVLTALGRDITQLAAEGKIDPVIGREREIRQVALVLARKSKNNPVLIGEAGVGKTAVVEALALQIISGSVPPSLRGKQIIEIPLSMLVAGTQYRGQFEERLNQLVEEVQQNDNVILFIDELHTLVGTGGGSGTLDAANILKPALARGDLRCIGATTLEEYHRFIEPDAALERRFSPVRVRELSAADTIAVLEGRRESFEKHHGVILTREAIELIVRLAMRHIPDRRMPDKALDLLDEACAQSSMARYLGDGVDGKWLSEADVDDNNPPQVTAKDVAFVLAERVGLSPEQLIQDDTTSLVELESILIKEAIGQAEACHQIASLLRSLQHAPEPKPISMIFAGPIGSGKRAVMVGLAMALFRDEAVVSFDMAEYRDKMDMEKLLGAPPGYIGHNRESLLSRRLRRDPYSVILLEHFDNGYDDIRELFLRGLTEGYINDNQGHTIHLENGVVVIMVDTDDEEHRKLGFGVAKSTEQPSDKSHVTAQIQKLVGKEVVDLVHQTIIFAPLDKNDLIKLAQRGLQRLAESSFDKIGKESMVFDEEIAIWLAEETLSIGSGRKTLERLLRTKIANPLRDALNNALPRADEVLFVSREDNQVTFNVVKRPSAKD